MNILVNTLAPRWFSAPSIFRIASLGLCVAGSVMAGFPARAADLVQTQPLDFGTVTILDFSTAGTVVLSPDGTYVASPQIAVTSSPTPARFEATDFPPSTAGTVAVTNGTVTEGGNGTGETFSITNFVTDPAVAVTDGAGDFTFDLGATLTTEGDGGAYPSGTYTGTVTVTVTF
ncbi:MAG TPA: DUF4402 domain-containing protein [Alphaproteobacteria bacterium]|nr:DUF4402 domain-containing protein [Alphaproteobacteria bacterium]